MFALMFVPVAVAIPRFLVVSNIGIYDTMLAHIVPLIAMPIGLFLVKQFMDQVPDELIEAAQMDGATNWIYLLEDMSSTRQTSFNYGSCSCFSNIVGEMWNHLRFILIMKPLERFHFS